jgi:hypothetical protein
MSNAIALLTVTEAFETVAVSGGRRPFLRGMAKPPRQCGDRGGLTVAATVAVTGAENRGGPQEVGGSMPSKSGLMGPGCSQKAAFRDLAYKWPAIFIGIPQVSGTDGDRHGPLKKLRSAATAATVTATVTATAAPPPPRFLLFEGRHGRHGHRHCRGGTALGMAL